MRRHRRGCFALPANGARAFVEKSDDEGPGVSGGGFVVDLGAGVVEKGVVGLVFDAGQGQLVPGDGVLKTRDLFGVDPFVLCGGDKDGRDGQLFAGHLPQERRRKMRRAA